METIEETTVYLPIEAEILRATPYLKSTLGKRPKALEKAEMLLGLLYTGREGAGRYVQLSSRQMLKAFGGGKSWQRISDALIIAGLIEKKDRYRVGSGNKRAICKSYRLTRKALGMSFVPQKQERPVKIDTRPVLEGVTIDSTAAIEIIDGLATTEQKKARARQSVERFNGRFSRGRTGRLFTPANGLPKELRQAVRINGDAVAEIDVKNCHPLLMATLYKKESAESARFTALVETGKLYEDIARVYGIAYTEEGKKKVKGGFTAWLGGGKNPRTYHYFQIEWPELFAVVKEMNAANKKAMCWHLQQLESAIIVDEFPARFGRQCISIHDGLLIQNAFAVEASEILKEIFEEFHGLTPSIH